MKHTKEDIVGVVVTSGTDPQWDIGMADLDAKCRESKCPNGFHVFVRRSGKVELGIPLTECVYDLYPDKSCLIIAVSGNGLKDNDGHVITESQKKSLQDLEKSLQVFYPSITLTKPNEDKDVIKKNPYLCRLNLVAEEQPRTLSTSKVSQHGKTPKAKKGVSGGKSFSSTKTLS